MEKVAIWVSVFSLIISILALIVSFFAYRRDRGILGIRVDFYLKTGIGTSFEVKLFNKGRRPLQIITVNLKLSSGKHITYKCDRTDLQPIPQTINESESLALQFPLYFYNETIKSPLEFSSVEVIDSNYKAYHFPESWIHIRQRMQYRNLLKQIESEWTPETDWLSESSLDESAS